MIYWTGCFLRAENDIISLPRICSLTWEMLDCNNACGKSVINAQIIFYVAADDDGVKTWWNAFWLIFIACQSEAGEKVILLTFFSAGASSDIK